MQKISIYFVLAFIIVAFIIGLGIGYAMTPQYRLAMYEEQNMGLGEADRWLDLRYVNAMIAHHQGAMSLARQAAQYGQRQEIKDLAAAILKDEPEAIAELYTWKKDWYQDKRQVSESYQVRLGEGDDKFDLRFLNALIAHHQAGVLMTQEIRSKSNRAEVLNNADAVELFLNNGISMLKDWRSSWYQI
jgi:uncharacterized protein (DUF305 family)